MHIIRTLGIACLSLVLLATAITGATNVSAHAGYTGDVDCDDYVNSIDSSLILQYGAGLISQLECDDDADINNDGHVNSLDAALILQYSAGLIDSLD